LLARIHELEVQLAEAKKDQAQDTRVSQLLARIHELEVAKPMPKKPLRDRADYMREYMRRRRGGTN
jgi:hypothetical protein